MGEAAAFYSYVRADDDHDDGYLSDLRRRLAAEVRMQTGEDFLIFQDREDILWGQRWQATINGTLDSTTFLIPVMTPAFFRSSACREEVTKFLGREAALGRDDLVLPIYYVESTALVDTSDPLAVELASRHYVDWRPLRFVSLDEPAARQELARLAGHIVVALGRGRPEPDANVAPVSEDDEDDAPGFVELVAEAEDAVPMFNDAIVEFTTQLEAVSDIAKSAGAEMNAAERAPRPASARLVILGRMAQQFDEPVTIMEELAEDYVEQLARVDGGIEAMAQRIPHLSDPDEIAAAEDLHGKLQELSAKATEGLGQLQEFANIVRETARLSRSVRPVLRRMTSAVDKVASSKDTITRWDHEFGSQLEARRDGEVGE